MEIISVYSSSRNSGKKTLAMALGQQAARRDNRTLLIELDYLNNGIAHTYGITNDYRNAERYFTNVFKYDDFNIGNYVMKKDQFEKQNKDLSKAHEAINSDLDFLIFSNEYKPALFPKMNDFSTEKVSRLSKRFFEELRQTEYDLVILVLPNQAEDMFTIPMIMESDHTINVVSFSLSSIEEIKGFSNLFNVEVSEKMKYVLNFTTKRIDSADYDHMMKPLNTVQLIPFEDQRMLNEVNAVIGSPAIDSAAVSILQQCDIDVTEKKRSFFKI